MAAKLVLALAMGATALLAPTNKLPVNTVRRAASAAPEMVVKVGRHRRRAHRPGASGGPARCGVFSELERGCRAPRASGGARGRAVELISRASERPATAVCQTIMSRASE